MADPTPTPVLTPGPPAEPLAYRPVSGLAIAALGFAALYTAIVLVFGVVALLQGVPFLLPTWLIVLPVAGAVLAFCARRQIRGSEGTRAGLKLAEWAWWLSVLAGLGYTAYAQTTALIIKAEADSFLREEK